MNQVQKMELQAENYRKELGRYRRQLEVSGMPSEEVEERIAQAQDYYNSLITNINNLKQ
tara:strand:+ start:450 stop:626 length:177 start_codon:yes stop_codon:yes gene_type:complete